MASLERLATRAARAVALAADAVRTVVERARQPRPIRHRFERFGAIVQLVTPRALVFVDRAYARRTLRTSANNVVDHPSWTGPEPALGDHHLSAPLEAHLQLTNTCDAGCTGCYTGASPLPTPDELDLAGWKRALDALASRSVFHVALGGGESTTLPYLGELAAYARSLGIVPNLTTSGLTHLDALLPIAHHFGQINVSLDGATPNTYERVRGFDGFARADAAIAALRARKTEIGINTVVTRTNFDDLDAIFAYAARRRLSEVELLRFKPSGRGARAYRDLACTDAQHRAFLPTILAAARRHAVRVKVDCSYTPMLAHHAPDPALLAELCVYGCTGGDFLVGAKANGALTACSFAPPLPDRPPITSLPAYWERPDAFGAFRTWRTDAQEPCRSCTYHALCRGGCKVVALHVNGNLATPDPECPRVVDAQRHRPRLPVI